MPIFTAVPSVDTWTSPPGKGTTVATSASTCWDSHHLTCQICLTLWFFWRSLKPILKLQKWSQAANMFLKKKKEISYDSYLIYLFPPQNKRRYFGATNTKNKNQSSHQATLEEPSVSLTNCRDKESGAARRSPKLMAIAPGINGVLVQGLPTDTFKTSSKDAD